MSTTRRLVLAAMTALAAAGGLTVPATTAPAAAAPSSQVADSPCLQPARGDTPAATVLAATGSVPRQTSNPALSAQLTRAVTAAARAEAGSRAPDQLWLDECGQAYYVDEVSSAPGTRQPTAEPGATLGTSSPLAPLAQTFTLHSKPGSQRTIFLDFDGHVLSGTAWNSGQYAGAGSSVSLPAYDSDGSVGSFSDSEKAAIQNVWAIVAEDYAPFDVDVTTETPSPGALDRANASDTAYGTRAVITGDTVGQAACSCGGVAYVGVFSNYSQHDYYQPALAFTRGVGTGAKALAEVVSHEVGHNLGLVHMGKGSSGYYLGHEPWAPIMGAGYYQPVTQWARGEYSGATSVQDEVATIQANGAPMRTDDHGGTPDTATALPASLGDGVQASGVIASAADVDAFTFTLAAPATVDLAVSAHRIAPDLDVNLRLLDAQGSLVAADNPAVIAISSNVLSGMDAALADVSLNAGRYTVTVDGSGFGANASTGYTDYGSMGTYTLTVGAEWSDGPVIGTTSVPAATLGVAYTTQLVGTSPAGQDLTWSLATGTLPRGLTLTARGVLGGKPSVAGTSALAVRATDTSGRSTTQNITLDVAAAVKVGGLSVTTAAAGTAYTGTVKVTGGRAPYSVTATSKPSWATVSAAGMVTGTPTRAETATFALAVTDAGGRTGSATVSLKVSGPLRIATTELPYDGTVVAGNTTTVSVAAIGGKAPYTWVPAASTLPAGVTLSTAGKLTFKGVTAGDLKLTVAVRDALGATATASYDVTVVPALTLTAGPAALTVGQALSLPVVAGGGTGELIVTAGALPSGWAFDGSALAGTPVSTSAVSVTFTVTDTSTGRTLVSKPRLTPRAQVRVTTVALPLASTTRSLSVTLRAAGGSARFAWSLVEGDLPAGVSLSSAGKLSGKPTETGSFPVTVRATDSEGRRADSVDLVLTVA